ncbi:MAG: DNA polymerase, partial [Candidatus Tectimicrobiota bacterium]
WSTWQASRGLSGSVPLDWVAGFTWTEWQPSSGLGGRHPWNTHTCHLALSWPLPQRILDLFSEFRTLSNGLNLPHGRGLLGALEVFGLDGISVTEKTTMRELCLRGGPYTPDERQAILDYCQTDVDALTQLLPAMLPHLDLARAVAVRGPYMAAMAAMEHEGIPVDRDALTRLRQHWPHLTAALIRQVDQQYGVFEQGAFREARWERWLSKQGIPWPRLPSGRLDLEHSTFKDMATQYPCVAPMRDLRGTLGQMRLEDLEVGEDGRNRTSLWAFSTKTARNAPGTSKFVFGPATWLRHLIRPESGLGLAYVDWKAAEIGIGAALSQDAALCTAYESGDPYSAFAMQSGAGPPGMTKASHPALRDIFKVASLAIGYGMGEHSLSYRIGQSPAHARQILRLHRKTYPHFWAWGDRVVDHAMLHGTLHTVFGWQLHVSTQATKRASCFSRRAIQGIEATSARTLRNFPAQANCAEILRLACTKIVQAGITLHAPIHDAVLVGGPVAELPAIVHETQRLMQQASEIVLGGFALQSEATCVYPGEHYEDPRGIAMWERVQHLMEAHTLAYA